MPRSPEQSFGRLNYHHLGYFWAVMRAGSVAAAAARLHLSQATVSGQVKALERTLGRPLWRRRGNRLEATALGALVFRYAEEIFALGDDLVARLDADPAQPAAPLQVGVADAVPKLVAARLLEPALRLAGPVRLTCHADRAERLLTALAAHELDLVLADHEMPPSDGVRAYHHLLGDCGVSWCAAPTLAERLRPRFPRSLHEAPVLLPLEGTALRRSLDQWFAHLRIVPRVVGEFADSALLKAFGHLGHGAFPVPSAIEDEVVAQYQCAVAGRCDELRERYYAISLERRLTHPALVAIASRAKRLL